MNFTSGDGMVSGNVRIGGDPTRVKGFYQEININKEANSIAFIVSVKSTGSSVPTGRDGRFYAIDVGLFFTDGNLPTETGSDWGMIMIPMTVSSGYGKITPSRISTFTMRAAIWRKSPNITMARIG